MRCLCCNTILNDFEATRRVASTGEFLDVCNPCYSGYMAEMVPTVCRSDLNPEEETNDDTELLIDEADVWLFDNDPDRE